jgi:hypothetical protein
MWLIVHAGSPSAKVYTLLALSRSEPSVGDPVRLSALASVEPLAGGRYVLRFANDAGKRLLVTYVEAKNAGPLDAKESGHWAVTLEADFGGTQLGMAVLREAKVTKAERKE